MALQFHFSQANEKVFLKIFTLDQTIVIYWLIVYKYSTRVQVIFFRNTIRFNIIHEKPVFKVNDVNLIH